MKCLFFKALRENENKKKKDTNSINICSKHTEDRILHAVLLSFFSLFSLFSVFFFFWNEEALDLSVTVFFLSFFVGVLSFTVYFSVALLEGCGLRTQEYAKWLSCGNTILTGREEKKKKSRSISRIRRKRQLMFVTFYFFFSCFAAIFYVVSDSVFGRCFYS